MKSPNMFTFIGKNPYEWDLKFTIVHSWTISNYKSNAELSLSNKMAMRIFFLLQKMQIGPKGHIP